jgi:hypothetical protein
MIYGMRSASIEPVFSNASYHVPSKGPSRGFSPATRENHYFRHSPASEEFYGEDCLVGRFWQRKSAFPQSVRARGHRLPRVLRTYSPSALSDIKTRIAGRYSILPLALLLCKKRNSSIAYLACNTWFDGSRVAHLCPPFAAQPREAGPSTRHLVLCAGRVRLQPKFWVNAAHTLAEPPEDLSPNFAISLVPAIVDDAKMGELRNTLWPNLFRPSAI